jgi:hypothetical protein
VQVYHNFIWCILARLNSITQHKQQTAESFDNRQVSARKCLTRQASQQLLQAFVHNHGMLC